MSDHSELKRLAEAAKGWDNLKSCWPEETEDGDLEVNWFVGGVIDDEKYPVVEVNTAQYDAFEGAGRLAHFYAAANPAVVLALIAEVDGLRAQHGRDSAELRSLCQARDDARKDRDQLKAEVARSTEREIMQLAEIEVLRKDAERWRFFNVVANDLQAFPHSWGLMTKEKMDFMCDEAMDAARKGNDP